MKIVTLLITNLISYLFLSTLIISIIIVIIIIIINIGSGEVHILTPLHNINRQNVMANKFILGRLGENQHYKVLM